MTRQGGGVALGRRTLPTPEIQATAWAEAHAVSGKAGRFTNTA